MIPVIPRLTAEIDYKSNIVNNDLNLSLCCSKKLYSRVDNKMHLYNWWKEHPKMKNALLSASSSKKREIYDHAIISAKRVSKAWRFLNSKGPILENLSPDLILDVANIVEPTNTYFRNSFASLQGLGFVPPNHAKIVPYLTRICDEIKSSPAHILEKSFYSHLMLVGLQSFNEANKRTARLIQNKLLYDHHLPPAIIPPGEHSHYLLVLEDALMNTYFVGDNSENNFKNFELFYTYMAGKVNTSLDDIIGHLKFPRSKR